MFRVVGTVFCLSSVAGAHNLDTRATSIVVAKDYVQIMTTRVANSQPAVQTGDEFWVLVKTTPGPGTPTGVGGYQTFYIPTGSQVVGAAYVRPLASDPRGFTEIPMKAQSPIAIGDGPVGAKTAVGLTGYTYPSANILGINEAPVTAAGISRGTLSGVYADTGIFYSTDPRTVFNSYGAAPTGGALPMINNSGDTVGEYYATNVPLPDVLGVMTLWDSYQLRAFGRHDVTPIIDAADGRGNAPWGMASAVAGPESGYKWSFNYAAYQSAGGTPAAIPAAIEPGPWNRIKYPGSQISKDQAGLVSSTLGYTGVDGSNIGYDFAASGALPTNTTAVRFAIGQLEIGRTEYSAVKIRINTIPSVECYDMYADAFGGDAGGASIGKDHLWRYFDPTVVSLDPCKLLQKTSPNPLIKAGDTTSFQLTFANLDGVDLPNVVLTDTLPSGLTYVGATPAPTTVSGSVLTWNLGNVPANTVKTFTLYVKGTSNGVKLNTLSATSNGTSIGTSYDTVEVALHSLLRKEKTVTPSNVAPNSDVTYTVTVYNDGTSANGTPLSITDLLPSGFTYQSFTSATLNGANYTPVITSTDPTKPVFKIGQGILPGKTLVIKFVAHVSPTTQPGTYFNGTDMNFEGKNLGPIPEAPVTVGGGQIGDTVWRDWNNNGVQDAGEEGIAGLALQLRYAGPDGIFNNGDDVLFNTTTDANGKYLFTGLAAGNYRETVTPPANYLQTFDADGLGTPNQSTTTLATNEIKLTQDFGYRFDPASLAAAQIGDSVFADINNDGEPDEGEAGIPGVTVWLYEDTNGNGVIDTGDLLVATTATIVAEADLNENGEIDPGEDLNGNGELDPDGFYYFPGLDPDRSYIVKVDDADPDLDAFFDPIEPALSTAGEIPVSALVLLPGERYALADFGYFGLEPASIGDTVFLDNNRNGIFDAGEAPLANITVGLYLDKNGDGIADTGELQASQDTDVNGTYLFGDLGPGNYIVKVLATDPDIPANAVATVPQIAVTLAAGDNYLSADFPYVNFLNKVVDKSYEAANGILAYTLSPYIPGNSLLNNAQITDPVPAGTTYFANDLPAATSEPSIGGIGNVVWNLGTTVAAADGGGNTPGYIPSAIIRSTTTEVDDSYIQEDSGGNDCFGNATTFLTRPESTKRKAALIKFTLPTLGANNVVDHAVIRVMITGARSNTAVTMHRMITPWVEGTNNASNGVTWIDPNGTGTPTTTWASGAFSASDYDSSVSYGTSSAPFLKGQILEFDVTDLVRAWRSGTPNNGIVLIASGTDTGDLTFRSSEGNAANTPGPRLIIGYSQPASLTPPAPTISTVRDNFGTGAYEGNDGSRLWAGSWVEVGDDGAPNGGSIRIANNRLQVKDDKAVSIYRSANLAGATAATLTYDLSVNSLDNVLDVIKLQASNNGGKTWTDLRTFTQGTTGAGNHDLISFLGSVTSNTRIRFTRVSSVGGAKQIEVDNLLITYTSPAGGVTSTSLSADTALLSGIRNVTVSMKVTSSVSADVTPPANLTVTTTGTASATKVIGPTPASGHIGSDGVTFTYIYQVDSGPGIGSVRFSGAAAGPGASVEPEGFAYVTGSSQSILTTAPLTFQVKVDSPAPSPGPIINTGTITANGGALTYNSPAAITSTTASIGDRLWADLDSDGVQDPGELGISGVEVLVYASDGTTLIGSATTDALGNYHVFGLAPGEYIVKTNASTFPAGYFPTTSSTLNVTLTSGLQYTEADFGLAPLPPGTGSIGDFVWIDSDNDGVQDAGETGIEGVNVILERFINGQWIQIATTTTDASGFYLFDALTAADYRVTIDTQSQISSPYAPGTFALGEATDPTYDPDGHVATPNVALITLPTDSTVISTTDFGYNYNGSIGDFVWWDLNHDGTYNSGLGETPLPNAQVLLYVDTNNNGVLDFNDTLLGTEITDASGAYLFDHLPPGRYFVEVYEDSVTVDGVRDIVPTTGEVVTVDLAPGGSYLDADFGFFEGARVDGKVYFDDNENAYIDMGEPGLGPVTVTLTGTDDFGNPVNLSTTTDASGNYHFIVPPGDYTVTYSTSETDALGYPRATTPESYTFHADAGEDAENEYNFGVDNSGAVGDTIFADANGNGTQDPGEPGLANITVGLYSDAAFTQLLSTQATDANGNYLFTGLSDGTYYVKVDTTTLPLNYNTTPTADPDATKDSIGTAVVSGGGSVLTMDFGYQYIQPTYTVSGTIWNDNGATGGGAGDGTQNGAEPGIQSVTVQAYVDTNNDGIADQILTTTTDSSGFYSFAGIPQNSNVIIKVGTDTLPGTGFGQTGDPDATKDSQTTITNIVANVTNENFGYREVLASLAGTVVSSANGDGIAGGGETAMSGVLITLRYTGADGIPGTGDDVVTTATTDASGAYNFSNLQPGFYQITKTNPDGYHAQADRDGGNPDVIELTIAAGNPLTGVGDNKTGQDFEITHASLGDYVWYDVNGNGVQNSGEPPLSGVRVYVDANGNGTYDVGEATALTDAAGAYTIPNLAPGTAIVRVDPTTLPGGLSPTYDLDGTGTANSASVDLVANQNRTDVDWGYQGTATVTGHLYVDANGNGIQDPEEPNLVNVDVVVTDSLGGSHTVVTDANGNWTVAVPAGTTTADVDESDPDFTALVLPGYVQTEGNDPTSIEAIAGTSTNGGIDGFFNTGSITGAVLADTNNDNTGDTGISGVTLTLKDSAGNDIDSDPIADGIQPTTTTTDANGSYTFGGLPPGSYRVVESQPSGYLSVSDVDGANNNIIGDETPILVTAGETTSGNNFVEEQSGSMGNQVWLDDDHDGLLDNGETLISDLLVRLDADLNNDGDFSDPGETGFATTTTTGGFYNFANLPPGNYQVVIPTPPATAPGVSEVNNTGDNQIDNDNNGSQTALGGPVTSPVINISAGENDSTIDFAFACQGTWEEWQYLNPLGGQNQPGDNPDVDSYDNLIEFAFNQPPASGAGNAWIIRPNTTTNPSTIEAVFTRPEGAVDNVTYSLQYASTLGDPTSWTTILITPEMMTVVDNGNCIETVTIHDLETLTGLTDGEGFIRIEAKLDADTDHTSYTEVEGWKETPLGLCCTTYNNPYLREAAFTGTVSSVSGQDVSFAVSGGGTDLSTILTGGTYYLEVTSGDNIGHRFDVVSATGNTITLASDSSLYAATPPFNTLTSAPPSSLAGDQVVVRRHWTLDEIFPPGSFGATGDPSTADEVQVFAGGVWTIYWLYNGIDNTPAASRWVDAADAGMANQGTTIIPPGQGMFFNNRTAATSLLAYGEVRANPFIRPLATGSNLVGGGYPLDQSATGANSREMTLAAGFFGSRDFKTADSFSIWREDSTSGASGYDTYYLLDGSPNQPSMLRWVKVGDTSIQARDAETLFLGDHSVFLKSKTSLPAYTIPLPWTP